MQSSNLEEHLYGSNNNDGKSNIDNLNHILDNLEITSDNEINDNDSITPNSLHNNNSESNFNFVYEESKLNEQFIIDSIERIELLFKNKDG